MDDASRVSCDRSKEVLRVLRDEYPTQIDHRQLFVDSSSAEKLAACGDLADGVPPRRRL